jgi:plastocyanin
MTIRKSALACALCVFAAAGAAQAVQSMVTQKGKVFSPDELTLAVGDTVHIDNDDNIPHNVLVTAPGGVSKNFGVQNPGDHADIIIDTAGEYTVRCGIHPKMKLVIQAN